ncbi:hypothetical protein RsoM2USA_101 [Ralstonia phage RsoM2USA]|nr:hypothetical protein RsoM2USA_101 [Ralstonia phage RsoM2USA]
MRLITSYEAQRLAITVEKITKIIATANQNIVSSSYTSRLSLFISFIFILTSYMYFTTHRN